MTEQPLDELAARKIMEGAREIARGHRRLAREEAEGVAEEKVSDHEERMHVPTRDMSPLTAVPFPEESIPDPHLKQMVEMIEREGLSEGAAAAAMGYPLSLAHRELSRYYARHERLCQEWATP